MRITEEIGVKIKEIRKAKNLTMQQLGEAVYKSKATIAKYETGFITIDIETLYLIADALNVQVEQLLVRKGSNSHTKQTNFSSATDYYTYVFDGRNNRLLKSFLRISDFEEGGKAQTAFYMNVPSFDRYVEAENTYWGHTKHHDTLTSIQLNHQTTSLETVVINILSTFQETDERWGMMSGVSFRPFMPVAWKMLFSRKPLKEDDELISRLKIDKEDIRLMKLFNVFNVM